jgi:hypothetical protein
MNDPLKKREPDRDDDCSFDWPFDHIALSEPARAILERFWYQISQRRPFKWDFPDMYEKELGEFNEMFLDIANTIDEQIRKLLEESPDAP